MRKNLKTRKFEVYRRYVGTPISPFKEVPRIGQVGAWQEEVIFEESFEDALKFAGAKEYKFHAAMAEDAGGFIPQKVPCEHKSPKVERAFCQKMKAKKDNVYGAGGGI